MKAIVVVDKNWAIGRDGKLLTHLPGDLKYFKEKTLGNVVIMGRRTLESLPGGKALPGRETIVLSRNKFYTAGCRVLNSVEEVMDEYKEGNIFICGGQDIYELFLPYCESCLVTKLDCEFEADKFFPNLDEDPSYELTHESPIQEENGIKYKFTEYTKL